MEKEKPRIDHWVYEIKVPEDVKIALDRIEIQYGPLGEQFYRFMIYMNSHKEEYWQLVNETQDISQIEFVAEYPVYEGETEAEARIRAANNNGGS